MSTIQIIPSDQGGTFTANLGDMIVIRLEENLTTGYQWEIALIDNQIVELVDSDYSPIPTAGVGSGGTRTTRFIAKSSGSGQIQLRLRRSWEPIDAAVAHFAINIQVH